MAANLRQMAAQSDSRQYNRRYLLGAFISSLTKLKYLLIYEIHKYQKAEFMLPNSPETDR